MEEILEVVGPAGVEAAQRATERLAMRHQEQRQLLVDRVQAAVEAEQRAAREYTGSSGRSAPRLREVDTLIPIGVVSKGSKPGGQHVHESVVSRVSHPRLQVHTH